MQIEYASLLRNKARALDFEKCFKLPQGFLGLFYDRLSKVLQQIEVSDCPSMLDSHLSSPLAFRLSAILGRFVIEEFKRESQPALLAQMLLDVPGAESEELWVKLSIGGLGYLNAELTQRFVSSWLQAVIREEGVIFFSGDPVMFKGCELGDKSRAVLRFIPAKLLKSITGSANEDVRELWNRFGDLQKASFDDLIMLLALLVDQELEADTYLNSLFGADNIPWLLRRVQDDLKSYISSIDNLGYAENLELNLCWNDPARRMTDTIVGVEGRIELILCNMIKEILGLRVICLQAARSGKLDQLVGALIRITRCFYSYYNHPHCRDPQSLSAPLRSDLLLVSRVTNCAVSFVLEELERCWYNSWQDR